MNDIAVIVFDKLEGLVRSDPELTGVGDVQLGKAVVGDGKCLLTLDVLFSWVQEELPIDYRQFRSQLYRSTLNQQLKDLGYTMEVASASAHVDSTIYQLVKL